MGMVPVGAALRDWVCVAAYWSINSYKISHMIMMNQTGNRK